MFRALATFLFMSACVTTSMAQDRSALAARIELRPFQSLTLSDTQFLKGEGGTPVTLAAELRFPATASTGKLPAVILVHGSGGVSSAPQNWSQIFNRLGIATLTIDSFSGRGLTQVSTNQAALGRFNMTLDAFRAQEMLAAHPRIDPQKIAVMGFSRGGSAVFYSTLRRFQKTWSPNYKVAATYPMYASCFDHVDEDTDVAGPIREFHGGADDYASIAKCRALVERLREAGRDVQSVEYPGVHHSFDNVLASPSITVSKGSQSQRNCEVVEEKGVLVNRATGREFTYADACITVDPHSGYDAAATEKTIAAIVADVKARFALQ